MIENSFNNEPRIQLVNKEYTLIEMISQIEAFRLLRNGFCNLLMIHPPTVQFQLDSEWNQKFKSKNPPHWFKQTAFWLTARRTNLYGNFHIIHPDGHIMFHCDAQRALWYLNHDLAVVISENPPALQLQFAPKGLGHIGDDYYLTGKVNQCVCCGSNQNLSRHHVMPRVFRKHMPKEVKEHNYHDVLLLCVECHCRYEQEAGKFKQEICQKFGIILNSGAGPIHNPEVSKAKSAARALLQHSGMIPKIRIEYLTNMIRNILGKDPTEEDLLTLAKNNKTVRTNQAGYGKIVVDQILVDGNIQEFTELWRTHFVEFMNPLYLPEHWDIGKTAKRTT